MTEMVSVVIVCYENFQFIYQAIESVMNQNYDSIELMVSDDGSNHFPREEILRYIQANKRKNIRKVIVRQEEKNVGTVMHMNHAFHEATGAYICALAGDDMFDNEDVISRYVSGFKNASADCLVQVAQTAMYDKDMKTLDYYFVQASVRNALEAENSGIELYNLLSIRPCMPSNSTVFRKEFFERFGYFDTSYKILEDYPTFLRLARENWAIHFENYIAIKHRDGGISHGHIRNNKRAWRLYCEDMKRVILKELDAHTDLLHEEEKKRFLSTRKTKLATLDLEILGTRKSIGRIVTFVFNHPVFTFSKILYALHGLIAKIKWKIAALGLLLLAGAPYIGTVLNAVMETLHWKGPSVLTMTASIQSAGLQITYIGIALLVLYGICHLVKRITEMPSFYV